jgi:hypothetical protein
MKCVFWISLQVFVWNISQSTENWARYKEMFIDLHVKYRYSCQVVMKLEHSQTEFRKILKYQVSWNSIQWELNCSRRIFSVVYSVPFIVLWHCTALCYCFSSVYCTVSACDVRAATLTEVFPWFSSVVRQVPGYNSQRRDTACISQIS